MGGALSPGGRRCGAANGGHSTLLHIAAVAPTSRPSPAPSAAPLPLPRRQSRAHLQVLKDGVKGVVERLHRRLGVKGPVDEGAGLREPAWQAKAVGAVRGRGDCRARPGGCLEATGPELIPRGAPPGAARCAAHTCGCRLAGPAAGRTHRAAPGALSWGRVCRGPAARRAAAAGRTASGVGWGATGAAGGQAGARGAGGLRARQGSGEGAGSRADGWGAAPACHLGCTLV
jgi:hypothetical protein